VTIEPYVRFAELLSEATLVLSEDGVILSANRAVADQLGLDPGGLPGRWLADVATDPHDAIAQYLRACSRARDLVLGSVTLSRGDGRTTPCRAEGAVLRPCSEGVPPLLLLRLIPLEVAITPPLASEPQADELAREGAARKRAEAALRESEERLRLALDAGRMGTWDLEIQTGRFTWSRSLETLYGLAPGTFSGALDDVLQAINPEDRETVMRTATLSLEARTWHTVEYRVILPDGGVRWLESRGRFLYEDDGRATRMLGICADITERKRAEAALRESDERLRLALEAGRMGTWDWEVRTGQVTWSPSLETLHGLAPGTFDGTFATAIAMIHPEDRELVTRSAARGVEGTGDDTQFRIVRPDGSIRWLEGRGKICHDESGEPALMLGVCMDITELKRAEEALRESEAKYRRIIETAAEGILVIDSAGQTVYVNQQLADMVGYPVEELLGRSGFDLVLPEDRAEAERQMGERRRGIRATFDFRLRRKDGSEIWTSASVNPIFDDAGEFLGALGMVTDITERKRAEEDLRRERDFAEGLIETAQAIVLVLDTDGRIVRFNPYMEALSGYPLEEVQGLDWFSTLLPERDRPRIARLFAHALADGDTRGTITPIATKDGRERTIEWSNKPLKDGRGDACGLLSIGRDITDLKEAERRVLQAERLAAIGEMVTGLAHESRNALQRGQVCLEMLAIEVEDRPEALRLITRLQKAQDDLYGLYEDVRDYAAPINLERKSCHLAEIWRAAWTYLDPVRNGRDATLLEEIGGLDLGCVVDPSRLEQVFRNILENALAACQDPVAVAIGCAPADLDGHSALLVTLRDNGPGLDPEQRRRIFEPFFTTKTKGTGLGMAIARRIVDAHGGRIAVSGAEGPGAEIILTLPRGRP
jgi:PAS domain S-box-containing protein